MTEDPVAEDPVATRLWFSFEVRVFEDCGQRAGSKSRDAVYVTMDEWKERQDNIDARGKADSRAQTDASDTFPLASLNWRPGNKRLKP